MRTTGIMEVGSYCITWVEYDGTENSTVVSDYAEGMQFCAQVSNMGGRVTNIK